MRLPCGDGHGDVVEIVRADSSQSTGLVEVQLFEDGAVTAVAGEHRDTQRPRKADVGGVGISLHAYDRYAQLAEFTAQSQSDLADTVRRSKSHRRR